MTINISVLITKNHILVEEIQKEAEKLMNRKERARIQVSDIATFQ